MNLFYRTTTAITYIATLRGLSQTPITLANLRVLITSSTRMFLPECPRFENKLSISCKMVKLSVDDKRVPPVPHRRREVSCIMLGNVFYCWSLDKETWRTSEKSSWELRNWGQLINWIEWLRVKANKQDLTFKYR